MRRSENGETLDCSFHLRRDECTFPVFLTTVDDAMADDVDVRRVHKYAGCSVPEDIEHALDDAFSSIHRDIFLQCCSVACFDCDFSGARMFGPVSVGLPDGCRWIFW